MLWVAFGAVLIGVPIILGGLILLMEKVVPHHIRAEHNDVAGFVYAVLGVMYAVMLAFVVVNEWGAMDVAEHNTFTEADELGALYWNARALPPDVGRGLENTTKQYAQVVIDKEWPRMASGGYLPEATDLVYQMRDEINALPKEGAGNHVLYDQSLTHVNNLAAARRERLSESSSQVPAELWVALIIGAILTIGYTFLFGLPKFWSHLLIAGPLAMLVAIALVLIIALDHPFTGAIGVHAEAFEIFLRGLPATR